MVEEPARGRGAVSKWVFHTPPPGFAGLGLRQWVGDGR